MSTRSDDSNELDGESGGGLSRREMLTRGAVAAGTAGVMWAAPTIQGLSIRPDFAAAASGPCSGPRQFNVPLGNTTDFAFDFDASIGCATFRTHWHQHIDSPGDFASPSTGNLTADKVSG